MGKYKGERHWGNRGYSRYLHALGGRVLVFDGGMGTSLGAMGLSAGQFGGEAYLGCYDALCLSGPEAVTAVHRAFLAAGADVIETNTFRAHRPGLAVFGLEEQVAAINRAAAGLARQAADSFSRDGRSRFVAGAMGPVGETGLSRGEVAAAYQEQAAALLAGGVDLLLLETFQSLAEVEAAAAGARAAMAAAGQRVPLQAHVSPEVDGRLRDGASMAAVAAALERRPVDAIGLNCGYGPAGMGAALAELARVGGRPLFCLPNAGRPERVGEQWVYPEEPEGFAATVEEQARVYGLRGVGGCCGATPEHIGRLAAGLGRRGA